MTVLDVIIVLIVLAAAVAGFRSLGGSARAGTLLGLLVGAGLCAAFGARLAALGQSPTAQYALGLVGIIGGLLLGAAIGGWLGRLLSRVLISGRLAVLDRAVGAVAGAASAVLVMWLVAWVVPAVVGAAALEPVAAVLAPLGGHSSLLASVGRVLPDTTSTVTQILDGLHPPGLAAG
ncbi:hypothetical protein [Pseudonocardia sp. GCM10023141]|uniref:hypothetical protein n=1 Tax=Pseudonocardia sp. GCM10023141 TaxID=3252653 RepID=UPI003612AD93